MKSLLYFVAGCALAIAFQSGVASALPRNNSISTSSLQAELRTLKYELASAKRQLSTRLDGLERDTRALKEKAALIEQGEPRQFPLVVR